jgi:GrpB-like predicted nucleotidyltransferase (UPF0157 family)
MALAVRVAGRELRTASRNVALRIDHTGSISVPGLAAKPIIDVQISVVCLERAPRGLHAVSVYDITKGRVREVGLPR